MAEGGSFSTEAILLAVVPKVTSTLSMIGSGLIILYIAKRRSQGRAIRAYHRIMFSMCSADLVASASYFAGTFPIPQGTVGNFGEVHWAFGTKKSCRVCGVWSQLQVLPVLYNGMLCLYYLLVVKFQWRESQVRAIEPFMHIIPLLFAVSTSIAGAVIDAYGSVEWLCWIDQSRHDFQLLRLLFLFAPVWFCWGFVSVVMFILYKTMRKLEQANKRYAGGANNEKSTQIAVQGMLYVASFYVTWLFPSIQRILELANVPSNFALQMLDTSLLPLQGLFNALIYVRPRFVRLRKRKPDLGFWQIVWMTGRNRESGSERQLSRPNSNGTLTEANQQPAVLEEDDEASEEKHP